MRIAFFGDSLTEGVPGAAYFDLLRQNLPQHELLNYGKGGDTVVSLHRRIMHSKIPSSLDMAFLWVGVNDVLVYTSWTYPLLKLYRRQPWARNVDTFVRYYGLLLEQLTGAAKHVVAVSPHLIGEDLENPWNRKLKNQGDAIKTTIENMPNVSFLDLKEEFRARLAGQPVSPYIPRNALRFLLKSLPLQDKHTLPKITTEQRLRLTLDGVHLNADGAELVAQVFSQKIREWERQVALPDTSPDAN